jgi:hypothetical protein
VILAIREGPASHGPLRFPEFSQDLPSAFFTTTSAL